MVQARRVLQIQTKWTAYLEEDLAKFLHLASSYLASCQDTRTIKVGQNEKIQVQNLPLHMSRVLFAPCRRDEDIGTQSFWAKYAFTMTALNQSGFTRRLKQMFGVIITCFIACWLHLIFFGMLENLSDLFRRCVVMYSSSYLTKILEPTLI